MVKKQTSGGTNGFVVEHVQETLFSSAERYYFGRQIVRVDSLAENMKRLNTLVVHWHPKGKSLWLTCEQDLS